MFYLHVNLHKVELRKILIIINVTKLGRIRERLEWARASLVLILVVRHALRLVRVLILSF